MDLSAAPVTYALIVANLAASLYALYGDRNFFSQFAFEVDAVVRRQQSYRVVTSSFLHGDLFHLFFNMLTLFYFGPVVERILGKLGFLVVYFGAIIASGVVTAIVKRRVPNYRSVGASDAVSGVLLSFCLFFPLEPIYILFIPVGIPAILYGVLFMLISARLMGNAGNRIAHEGHLGGALAGVGLTLLMRPDVVTQFFS
ncbi:MAG: rhomboid family intramembrane serine protease [Pseudomonadota bacterium]|nr:rhomboid family intramembrane serine protease [Pseudomonadota bacterium]